MNLSITTQSPESTHALGVRIGQNLQGRDVILLEGELGSGKTLLTKGIYTGLGGQDEE
ncbi:MAG: tRNA threonylcarbamoyladenosine biosynthesis protein TsaE, partial [Planctomycetota bacterium]